MMGTSFNAASSSICISTTEVEGGQYFEFEWCCEIDEGGRGEERDGMMIEEEVSLM